MNAVSDPPIDQMVSPFSPEDEKPLRRFIERMIGQGFAMVVVLGERLNGLEEVAEWFQAEGTRLQSKMHKVNLGRFTFNNPWLELDHTIGKIPRSEKTILLLHGIDPRSELKKDDEIRLFRQLNVQRDSLTRDFPSFWVLYVPPRLEYQLRTQAPDFCEFVGYWCTINAGKEFQRSEQFYRDVEVQQSIAILTPFGFDQSLMAAFGDPSLVEIVKAMADWKLDYARGRIAQYELSRHMNARPGALDCVKGLLQLQEGNWHGAEGTFRRAEMVASEQENPALKGEVFVGSGDVRRAVGDLDQALKHYRSAIDCFERTHDKWNHAVVMGRIAGIHFQRGQTEAALRICREEQLPVFDRLGDVRLKAVTLGQIAEILQQRGQTDEALRIRREEQLPIFESLGASMEKALTMGQIAFILQQRGQLRDAFRIRVEEELAVYQRLGAVRLEAITKGQIADILQARGQIDEALRIRREEELPVYDRIGDIREKAVTMGKIADVLHRRGQTKEALRIWKEDELPVHERIGNISDQIICHWKIGRALLQRGRSEDRPEASAHLQWALTEARKLQMPEAVTIEKLLNG